MMSSNKFTREKNIQFKVTIPLPFFKITSLLFQKMNAALFLCLCACIYIYIYIERERERDRQTDRQKMV